MTFTDIPDFALRCPACDRWPAAFAVTAGSPLWHCLSCDTVVHADAMVAANEGRVSLHDVDSSGICDGLFFTPPAATSRVDP